MLMYSSVLFIKVTNFNFKILCLNGKNLLLSKRGFRKPFTVQARFSKTFYCPSEVFENILLSKRGFRKPFTVQARFFRKPFTVQARFSKGREKSFLTSKQKKSLHHLFIMMMQLIIISSSSIDY